MTSATPIGFLALNTRMNNGTVQATSEPVYGGYMNARGQISLFGSLLVFRLNLKHNTARKGPPLNCGAQARYDATEAGESFEYCSATFLRLSANQIKDICSSSSFRTTLRAI